MTRKTKLTVVPTPPADPPPSEPRAYADFDAFVKLGDQLVRRYRQIEDQLLAEDTNTKIENWFSRKFVDKVEAWTAETLPDSVRLLAEFRAAEAFYDRAELYADGEPRGTLAFAYVSEQVTILVGSFPNAVPHTPQVYMRLLIEEILATKTSALVVESACRHIRRTMKFAPSIAEMLEVIEAQREAWGVRWQATAADAGNILTSYDELRKVIVQAKAGATSERRSAQTFQLPAPSTEFAAPDFESDPDAYDP